MPVLETELLAILEAIAKALANSDHTVLAVLEERKQALCRLLAALDPVCEAARAA